MISRITDRIFIGEQSDAINEHVLKQLHIDCIINVNDRKHPNEELLAEKLGINYITYEYGQVKTQKDFKDILKDSSEILYNLPETYQNILVHCEAGIDRAPFVVTLYLAKQKNIPYEKAFNIVKYYRRHIMIHPEWL
jgi:protein tyrosine/serine phosphatase